MSFIDKVESVVNLPVVLQVGGAVVFGLTVWKGVHGFLPSFGLIAGAAMVYVGKHFAVIYK
jgi:hypothetical protein